MAQQNINTDIPNSGNGDTLRDAFVKSEANFTELYNTKVDKISGKGLSTNDYTTAEKNKLAGIPADAEKNVQSDWLDNDPDSDSFILNKPDVIGSVEWGNIEGNIEDQEDLQNAFESKQYVSEKDSPNGYAGLDADGKILRSQLPSTTIIPIANFLIFKIGTETPYELEAGDLVQGIVENMRIEGFYLGGDTSSLESFNILTAIDLTPTPIGLLTLYFDDIDSTVSDIGISDKENIDDWNDFFNDRDSARFDSVIIEGNSAIFRSEDIETIEFLYLYNMGLIDFEVNGLDYLRELNLNNNGLSQFDPSIALPQNLTNLDLNNNQLTEFNPSIALPPYLGNLYISNNLITTTDWNDATEWISLAPDNAYIYTTGNTDPITGTTTETLLLSKGWIIDSL